jgi:DNA-binding MarR family transcriptional regulator
MEESGRIPEGMFAAANEVRRGITRMARRLRRLRSDHGVRGSKLSILGWLFRRGTAMTATDLARLERLKPQSLTRLVADLEQRGLIQRHQNDFDRRQILIEITPKGRELLVGDAHSQNEWWSRARTTRLTAAECELLRITSKLLDQLAEDDADAPQNLPEPSSPGGSGRSSLNPSTPDV